MPPKSSLFRILMIPSVTAAEGMQKFEFTLAVTEISNPPRLLPRGIFKLKFYAVRKEEEVKTATANGRCTLFSFRISPACV